MKTQVQDTSINCYHKVIEGGYEASQNAKVYDMLKRFETATGRMISFKTGLESNVVGRCLNAMEKQGIIERAFRQKCQISKIEAWYWQLKKKPEPVDPGKQARINF